MCRSYWKLTRDVASWPIHRFRRRGVGAAHKGRPEVWSPLVRQLVTHSPARERPSSLGAVSDPKRGTSGRKVCSHLLHLNPKILRRADSPWLQEHANSLRTEAMRGLRAMKVLQTSCMVCVTVSVGFYLAGGNRPAATEPNIMPEAADNVTAPAYMVTPAVYAEASARLAAALRAKRAELGSATSARPVPLSSGAEIADNPVAPKLASLRREIVQPLPTARDVPDDAPKAESAQDLRYLIYYV